MAFPGKAPPFWWQRPDWRAWALWPAATIYGAVAAARLSRAPREKVAAAVLCVGNLTVGGEGKTPVAIALAGEAQRQGWRPGFLSRGHGGRLTGPHLVDAGADTARRVGDEPLLLARHAPTVVTPDRAAGARRLIAEGCDFLIMDDGFQSAHLHMDYALIVVDAARGLGNGHVVPAGPLRAPVAGQMRHVDGVLVMGKGRAADTVVRLAARAGKPVFVARLEPGKGHGLAGERVLAFAGIGNPDKFYRTLQEAGATLAATRSFPDHHPYGAQEAAELVARAAREGLTLVTTEKDLVRMRHGPGAVQALAAAACALPVAAVFEEPAAPARIVRDTLDAWQKRRAAG
ncbi:tetraacyldisaccharide 4'-kinase [Chelativorans intermedius]|uniref:Tetraacyldisaccharide 4'-kinase n=1 Tax=Chelativorans intermedius TaxID=515947 RepID=A0ABV6D7M4_9HYPH|nr:tetraacyldisaccharide 4'-kinase [Chelativorans intermedius]MCT8999799.1 tetraacyldisaccharide 4'-kinase [Chelativorans intermedius]